MRSNPLMTASRPLAPNCAGVRGLLSQSHQRLVVPAWPVMTLPTMFKVGG